MTYTEALEIIDTQFGAVLEAACFLNKADCPTGMSQEQHTRNRIKAVRVLNATVDSRRFMDGLVSAAIGMSAK